MRKFVLGAAVLAAVLVPAAAAAPAALAAAGAKVPPPPVKLSGKVNNHGTATATGGAIEIDQHDFFFSPTFIKVPAGVTSVTVTVKNVGQAQHTFTVPSANIDQVLNPGQSMMFTVPMSGHGAIGFYCRFHKSLGMQGAFFTKKGAKVVAATGSSGSSGSSGGSGGATSSTSAGGSGGYGY